MRTTANSSRATQEKVLSSEKAKELTNELAGISCTYHKCNDHFTLDSIGDETFFIGVEQDDGTQRMANDDTSPEVEADYGFVYLRLPKTVTSEVLLKLLNSFFV